MLFEAAGDSEPILKLYYADCVTTANQSEREFVITHKVNSRRGECIAVTREWCILGEFLAVCRRSSQMRS